MKELIRTNDLILITHIQSLLIDAGIDSKVLDTHTSNIEGSISAIKRRIMVSYNNYQQSKNIINTFISNIEIE